MPVTRLYPNATTGGALGTNAATHHEGLSDANDATYSSGQLSASEPIKTAEGPSITQLPTLSGVMKGVTINCRAYLSGGGDGDVSLIAGENASNRFGGVLTNTVAQYSTAQLNLGQFAAVNALGWNVGISRNATDGVIGYVTELNFDVEWLPVSGFKALIFELLGPLVAVGLHEMPRLSAELWRRGRTRLLRHEMEPAWRGLREDRARRLFLPGRCSPATPRRVGLFTGLP